VSEKLKTLHTSANGEHTVICNDESGGGTQWRNHMEEPHEVRAQPRRHFVKEQLIIRVNHTWPQHNRL
jgi:hypothetical protein